MYTREGFANELKYFESSFPNKTEFNDALLDFLEEIQDEAAGTAEPRAQEPKQEEVTGIALGIQIYKVLVENNRKHPLTDLGAAAYEIAKDLDFHFRLHYKHGSTK